VIISGDNTLSMFQLVFESIKALMKFVCTQALGTMIVDTFFERFHPDEEHKTRYNYKKQELLSTRGEKN